MLFFLPLQTTENALQHEEIQGYLKNGKKFDVVLCMAGMLQTVRIRSNKHFYLRLFAHL